MLLFCIPQNEGLSFIFLFLRQPNNSFENISISLFAPLQQQTNKQTKKIKKILGGKGISPPPPPHASHKLSLT